MTSVPSGTPSKRFRHVGFLKHHPATSFKRNHDEAASGRSPYYESVVESISNCDKIGYLGNEGELDAVIAQAEDAEFGVNVKFMKGIERLYEKWEGLLLNYPDGFSRPSFKKFESKLLDLVAHGIYQIWEKWDKILNKNEAETVVYKSIRRKKNRPNPLTMEANICTIFITYLVLNLIGLLVYLTEEICNYCNTLMILWKSIQIHPRKKVLIRIGSIVSLRRQFLGIREGK